MRGEVPEQAYLQALIQDLEQDLSLVSQNELVSIFFGGGTPSLFSAKGIETLLTEINQRIRFANDIEITLEANPGTVEQQRFYDYRQAGINRLSIGIQSFQADKLKQLGRIHDADEAERAVNAATQAGFSNFNLDLMHGLPQQTLDDALYDLQKALSLNPQHLSWYQLTLEPNTLFYRQAPTLPEEETLLNIQQQGHELLLQHNLQHYEVSAYAKAEQQCRHNVNYWEFGDYLGIGAGAHSKLTNTENNNILRIMKHKHPKQYLQSLDKFIQEQTVLNENDVSFEFMLNVLRLQKSISFSLYETRTGLARETLFAKLEQAKAKELLNWDADKIYVTSHGRRFLNDLQAIFLH